MCGYLCFCHCVNLLTIVSILVTYLYEHDKCEFFLSTFLSAHSVRDKNTLNLCLQGGKTPATEYLRYDTKPSCDEVNCVQTNDC